MGNKNARGTGGARGTSTKRHCIRPAICMAAWRAPHRQRRYFHWYEGFVSLTGRRSSGGGGTFAGEFGRKIVYANISPARDLPVDARVSVSLTRLEVRRVNGIAAIQRGRVVQRCGALRISATLRVILELTLELFIWEITMRRDSAARGARGTSRH